MKMFSCALADPFPPPSKKGENKSHAPTQHPGFIKTLFNRELISPTLMSLGTEAEGSAGEVFGLYDNFWYII